MKKQLFILPFFVFYTLYSYGNSYGRIGARVSSDILPNFVNLIFGGNGVSKATEAEMKQAEEELALSLRHARSFIADRYAKDSPYKASIKRARKTLSECESNIEMASRWRAMSEDEKYEYAKERLRESVNKRGANLFDERRC